MYIHTCMDRDTHSTYCTYALKSDVYICIWHGHVHVSTASNLSTMYDVDAIWCVYNCIGSPTVLFSFRCVSQAKEGMAVPPPIDQSAVWRKATHVHITSIYVYMYWIIQCQTVGIIISYHTVYAGDHNNIISQISHPIIFHMGAPESAVRHPIH